MLLPDGSYLHFGWWVDTPDVGDWHLRCSAPSTAAALPLMLTGRNDLMAGSATYNGAAAGVYVVKDIEAGRVKGAAQGQFTADARLRANFGTAD